MLKLVLLFFLCIPTYAEVGYGIKLQDQTESFLVQDFHVFSLRNPDIFGLNRYGIGRGQLEAGKELQVYADAHTGVFVYESSALAVGIEPASGKLSNYKQLWQPALSVGLHTPEFYIGPRIGYELTAQGRPQAFAGSVLQYQTEYVSLSYFETLEEKVYDFTTLDFNFQKKIDQKQIIYYIGIKTEF